MDRKDVIWLQDFQELEKAFVRLQPATRLRQQKQLSELEGQGLIQAFENAHELAWNAMKGFLRSQPGLEDIYIARDVCKEALKAELIEESEVWMEMLKDRNSALLTYKPEVEKRISDAILHLYYDALAKFIERLRPLAAAKI